MSGNLRIKISLSIRLYHCGEESGNGQYGGCKHSEKDSTTVTVNLSNSMPFYDSNVFFFLHSRSLCKKNFNNVNNKILYFDISLSF